MMQRMLRMFTFVLTVTCFSILCSRAMAQAPNSDIKFIAETLVVQADGTYEADPDLATLTFDISAQDKELRQTYDRAAQSMRKIADLAEKNGIQKADVSSGVLTVRPFYDGEKRKRAKYYLVQGQITLKIRDFSKLAPILDGSIEDGITDFRSLTYSIADEEAAKQHAVAEAMHRALGRASAALEQKGQKVGALRFANLDIKQLVGLSNIDVYGLTQLQTMQAETVEVSSGGGGGTWPWAHKKPAAAPPPPPLPRPEKITVSATVQCAFQIL